MLLVSACAATMNAFGRRQGVQTALVDEFTLEEKYWQRHQAQEQEEEQEEEEEEEQGDGSAACSISIDGDSFCCMGRSETCALVKVAGRSAPLSERIRVCPLCDMRPQSRTTRRCSPCGP